MKSKSSNEPWPIIIMTLLLVAVSLILGNQSLNAVERATFDEFNQRQLVLAREAAGRIELYFETLAGDLRALGKIPEVQHLDQAPTRREIQHTFDKLEPLGVDDIGVLDADGILRYNLVAPQIEGTDFSWRRYYQEAREMASSDTYVVEFTEFKGVEAGQKGVLIAVPLFETGRGGDAAALLRGFSGVVFCTFRLDTVTQKFVASIKSSERGHAILIDDEYNVLWSPDRFLFGENLLEESTGFPAFQQIMESMSAGNTGTTEYIYYELEESTGEYARGKTEEKLIAYTPVHLGDKSWAIGVWAPKEDARQSIHSAYLGQLLVVGLSILAILLGSTYALATFFRLSKFLEKAVKAKIEDLEAARLLQQSIVDGVAEPIMVIGVDYYVQLMNRAAREFSSGDACVAEPSLCYQISHRRETPCDGTEHPCPLEQVRESGQPVTVVHEHYQTNGERRLVEIIASPLWGEDGTFQGITESMRDITDRMRAEEALEAAYAFQQSLIDEERQRIARELHDGLAQLLGYVNTKAMAVRLMLENRRIEAAEKHLLQLEEAARELFVDVREAILDLKMSWQSDVGLADALRGLTAQFSQLSGLPVELALDSAAEDLSLAAEVELHLVRIVQEALANVRKHAVATRAWVSLQLSNGVLELTVSDDGKGFDLDSIQATHWPHLGLSTMRERAEVIRAQFDLRSEPGAGTCIAVWLAVDDSSLAVS